MGNGRGWLAGDWPSMGTFSTLLRRSGLRASSDGVLATKSERKMLASTCLYSLYAWFIINIIIIVFRLHGRTTLMWPIVTDSSVVCHDCECCKNSWTVLDAVWEVDSGWLKEVCIRWGCALVRSCVPVWAIVTPKAQSPMVAHCIDGISSYSTA